MKIKKSLIFLLLSKALFGFTLNVNLPRTVVLPVNENNSLSKTSNKVNKKNIKTATTIKQSNSNSKQIIVGHTKVVGNDDLDKLTPNNIAENICQAYISQNSSNAFDYGYEEGKKYTDLYIGHLLVKNKKYLDVLFPIQSFYIEGILEPPAVAEDKSEYTYDNGKAYKSYSIRYRIVKPARFVTKKTKKTWTDFLLTYPLNYYKQKINFSNLEFNFTIKWSNDKVCNRMIYNAVKKKFKEGFDKGRDEIELLYSLRLKQMFDYLKELYLYNKLYYKRIINPPVIGEFTTPVYTNNKDNSLIINENYYEIIKPARFNLNTKEWKVFLISHSKIHEIR